MTEELLLLIAEVMGVDRSEINDASNADTIGRWDSQREIELALELEHAYGIPFGPPEMERLRSVQGVRAVLREHGIDV